MRDPLNTPPTASRQQRRALDRLTREHPGCRIIVRDAGHQQLAVLVVDAREGISIPLTLTRGGFPC